MLRTTPSENMNNKALSYKNLPEKIYLENNDFSFVRLLSDNVLYDVEIICNNSKNMDNLDNENKINAHACVLAMSSEFMKTFFINNKPNKDTGKWRLDLDFDFSIVKLLIVSFYTGVLECSPNVLSDIIKIAMWFQTETELIKGLIFKINDRISKKIEYIKTGTCTDDDSMYKFVCDEIVPAYNILSSFNGTLVEFRDIGIKLVSFFLVYKNTRTITEYAGYKINYIWVFLNFVDWNDSFFSCQYNWEVMIDYLESMNGKCLRKQDYDSLFRRLIDKIGFEKLVIRYNIEKSFGYSMEKVYKIITENYLIRTFNFKSIYFDDFSEGKTGEYLLDIVGTNKKYTIKTNVESRAIFRIFLIDFTVNKRWWIYNGNIIENGKIVVPTQTTMVEFTCDEEQFIWNIGEKNDTNTTNMSYISGHRYALVLDFMGFSDWVSEAIGQIKLPYSSSIELAKNSNIIKKMYKGIVLGSRIISSDEVFFDTWFDDGDRGFIEESLFYIIHNEHIKSKREYPKRSTMIDFSVNNYQKESTSK